MPRIHCVTLLVLLLAPAASAQTLAPEWLYRHEGAWTGEREPQLSDRAAWFRRARRTEGALDGALLVCRVHVEGDWDLFADPDLRVSFRVGSRRGSVWGTENSRTEIFTIPGVRLRRGDGLSFRVIDRDMTFDEHIATIRGRYDGLETRRSAGQAEIECRAIAPNVVAARREAASRGAERALGSIEQAEPDLRAADLGRPSERRIREALLRAAAWTGWRDPSLRDARERLSAASRRFDGSVARAVRAAWREAPAMGERVAVDRGHATLEAYACAPREGGGRRCSATLRLEGDVEPVVDAVGVSGALPAVGSPTEIEAQPGARVLRVQLDATPRDAERSLLRVGRERALLRLR